MTPTDPHKKHTTQPRTRGLDISKTRLLSNGRIIDNNCVCINYMTGGILSVLKSFSSKVAPDPKTPTPTEPEAFKYILVWTGPVMEPGKAKSFEIRKATREEQDHLNYIYNSNKQPSDELKSNDRDGTTGVFEYFKVDHKVNGFTTANINESYFVSTNPIPKNQKDMLTKYKTSLEESQKRLKSLNKGGKKTKRRISKQRRTISNKKNRRV